MKISTHEAALLLKNGNVVAVPTETVYGLAACYDKPTAIEKIFTLKGRPRNNPLIIHISSDRELLKYVESLPYQTEKLTKSFWPGPLTLILPIKKNLVNENIRAGLNTAGFRVPKHPLAKQVLELTGPLVMPSANLSGRPSATTPEHVEEDFGNDFPVLDGGQCAQGVESTILYFLDTEWVILRLGALSPEEFLPVLGYAPRIIIGTQEKQPLCPGQHYRHYAPKATLFFEPQDINNTNYIIGFKERQYPNGKQVFYLGSIQDPYEVAEALYGCLRELDRFNAHSAWVDMNFPKHGLWLTIEERLNRAINK